MVLILNFFEKKTSKTPKSIIDVCKQRIKIYEKDIKGWKKQDGQKKKDDPSSRFDLYIVAG